jgi:hypothetical protein
MRIAQIILPSASEYEKKSQRVDQAALAERHEVLVIPIGEAAASGAQVAHVYATGELPTALFRHFPLPYVSSTDVQKSRWPFRRAVPPRYVVSPVIEKAEGSRNQPLPEAVEDAYFARPLTLTLSPRRGEGTIVGSFARSSTKNMVEQTLARIHRFREDVAWHLFDGVPTPEDLAGVDVWVDPAIDESDFDGFVAEALVLGLPIVASRTPINVARLERGRTGCLVPPRDPNEMTHAILAALFKREASEGKQIAARQTVSKFRPRQRVRVLGHLYETLIP